MRSTMQLALLGLVVCLATTQAQKTDLVADLTKRGHKLAAAILEISGVSGPVSDPKARYTFLLPTDAAIQTFLKDMGLTIDDLKKRPILAKQLVGQHTLLGSNVREQEIFEKGNTRKAASLASVVFRNGRDDLEFKRTAPGKFTVTDPQGNVANIVDKPFHPDDNKTTLTIDKVLMGDDYYTSFDDACKFRKARVSTFCDAVKSTGLGSSLKPSLDATVFVPNNDGFAKATAGGKPTNEQLAKILKYHVVPGARELAAQWGDGASYSTLLDNLPLKMTYSRKSAEGTKRPYDWAEAKVVGSDNVGVPILKANVHIGKTVVHGIGSVLNPNQAQKAAAATSTEKGKPSGRKLLVGGGGHGWGSDSQLSYGPTAVQDASSAAIAAAVAGDTTVAQASHKSQTAATALSIPGDVNQMMNGLDPW